MARHRNKRRNARNGSAPRKSRRCGHECLRHEAVLRVLSIPRQTGLRFFTRG